MPQIFNLIFNHFKNSVAICYILPCPPRKKQHLDAEKGHSIDSQLKCIGLNVVQSSTKKVRDRLPFKMHGAKLCSV